MNQPLVSQTIEYHSSSMGVVSFNIRVYDRPEPLKFEMWQVHWWRTHDLNVGDGEPRIHTDWNTKESVYPNNVINFGDFEEEVCVPGWSYWQCGIRMLVPIEDNFIDLTLPDLVIADYGSYLWSRDAQGDVDLYLVANEHDPEYELGGQ